MLFTGGKIAAFNLSNDALSTNNFLAVYFTITGLHALHIIGGIAVNGYFYGPGIKMWDSEPERFTNRIEIAEEMEIEVEELDSILRQALTTSSLDAPVNGDDGRSFLGDLIADGSAEEPLDKESPLLSINERLILTPHLGASTAEAQENVAIDVAVQIRETLY